jgi:hypothetical protein
MDEDDLDLAGVHPLLWNRTRARVAAIKQYLSLPFPTGPDEDRFAKSLGISSSHFRLLVRTWRRHKSAAALPGVTLKASGHPGRRSGLDPRTAAILAAAIAKLGPFSDAAEVHEEVLRRCVAGSAPPPHLATTRNYLMKAREDAGSLPHPEVENALLVIDHSAVELPVSVGSAVAQLPVVSLAITVPERIIVGHSIALAGPTAPRAATLLLHVLSDTRGETPVRRLKMNSGYTPAWRTLTKALESAGVDRIGRPATPVPSGDEITRLIGRKLGSLTLRPKLTHRTSEPANWRGEQGSLPTADLSAAIAAAIAEHNSKIGLETCGISIAQLDSRSDLLRSLARISQSAELPRSRTRK